MSPSLTLLLVGSSMVPGGALAPGSDVVAVAVIVAGSCMAIVGASVGVVPVNWKEISIWGLTGVIDTDEADFARFYREHRERLQRFAFLVCGDRDKAARLLREASARTREEWRSGTSADPRTATLRTLLRLQAHPTLLELFVTGGAVKDGGEPAEPIQGEVPQATLDALAELGFLARGALALHVVYAMGPEDMSRLLDCPAETVRVELERAIEHLGSALPHGDEARER